MTYANYPCAYFPIADDVGGRFGQSVSDGMASAMAKPLVGADDIDERIRAKVRADRERAGLSPAGSFTEAALVGLHKSKMLKEQAATLAPREPRVGDFLDVDSPAFGRLTGSVVSVSEVGEVRIYVSSARGVLIIHPACYAQARHYNDGAPLKEPQLREDPMREIKEPLSSSQEGLRSSPIRIPFPPDNAPAGGVRNTPGDVVGSNWYDIRLDLDLPREERLARAIFVTDPHVVAFLERVGEADYSHSCDRCSSVMQCAVIDERLARARSIAWERNENDWRREAERRASLIIQAMREWI